MKKADIVVVLTQMDKLTELMNKYEQKTDQMVTADLEIIQQVLMSRNDIMEEMRIVKAKIVEIIELQNAEEKKLLRDILNNKPVQPQTDEQLQLQVKMKKLHNIKLSIEQKDKKVTAYVQQSYEDVKAELESLQKDKKKIDYYSSVRVGGKGNSFDSHS